MTTGPAVPQLRVTGSNLTEVYIIITLYYYIMIHIKGKRKMYILQKQKTQKVFDVARNSHSDWALNLDACEVVFSRMCDTCV